MSRRALRTVPARLREELVEQAGTYRSLAGWGRRPEVIGSGEAYDHISAICGRGMLWTILCTRSLGAKAWPEQGRSESAVRLSVGTDRAVAVVSPAPSSTTSCCFGYPMWLVALSSSSNSAIICDVLTIKATGQPMCLNCAGIVERFMIAGLG